MMKSYTAAFSHPFHVAYPQAGESYPVKPSLYCLSGTGAEITYDRYEWATITPPWDDDTCPAHSGKLSDLIGGYNVFTGNPIDEPTLLDGTKPLDAALYYMWAEGYAVWLFQGTRCMPVSISRYQGVMQATIPLYMACDIKEAFGYEFTDNNPEFPFPDGIDAVLHSPKDAKIWWFKDSHCVSADYSSKEYTKADTYPTIHDTWTGLPTDYNNGISLAATALDTNGPVDNGYLVTGTDWRSVTPSTTTATFFTDPGDYPVTVPDGINHVTLELWGPGGRGGSGGSGGSGRGGSGGAGAYLRDKITVTPNSQLAFHVGAPGDCTQYPATGDPILIAGGGGGGGGGGEGGYGGLDYGHGGNGGNGGGSGSGSDGGNGGNAGRNGSDGSDGGNRGNGSDGGKGGKASGNSMDGGNGSDGGKGGKGGKGGHGLNRGGDGGDGGKGYGGYGGGGGGGGGTDYAGKDDWAGAGGGGGGGQGPCKMPDGSHFDGGDGASPAGKPPVVVKTDGTPAATGGAPGKAGGNGAVRVSWYSG